MTMTNEQITDLLFVCEQPIPADLAMVFGADNETELGHRVTRGVQLYQDSFVPRLMVTGGGVLASTSPEADRMREVALDLGVPPERLLVEDTSRSTIENATYSMRLLEEQQLLADIKTIILVSSEWHMRRVRATMKAVFPQSIKYVCCPAIEGCTRGGWTESESCVKKIKLELMLYETFRETGAIAD